MPRSRYVVYRCEKDADRNAGISLHKTPTLPSERAKWLRFVRTYRKDFAILSHKVDLSSTQTISKSTASNEALLSGEVNELLYQVQRQPFGLEKNSREAGFISEKSTEGKSWFFILQLSCISVEYDLTFRCFSGVQCQKIIFFLFVLLK